MQSVENGSQISHYKLEANNLLQHCALLPQCFRWCVTLFSLHTHTHTHTHTSCNECLQLSDSLPKQIQNGTHFQLLFYCVHRWIWICHTLRKKSLISHPLVRTLSLIITLNYVLLNLSAI